MVKVVKFGGSSVATGEAFDKVKKIVTSDKARTAVVVSAPGKRFSGDTKVTDLLYVLHAHVKYNAPYDEVLLKIKERYEEIKAHCNLKIDLDAEFALISAKLSKKTSVDYIVSRGEYLSAKLMAEYLGYEFIDSATCLYFDYNGKVKFEETYEAIAREIATKKKVVISGFYGSDPSGEIKTFSRGGSDITGSIVAAAIGAESYENWTDVSGIMSADPRIVDNPTPIANVTFAELRELSYMGAEVLHEDAVFPVRDKNIPLYIKNTNDIDARGTLVMESFDETEKDKKEHFVTGVSGKKDFAVLTFVKNGMTEDVGFINKVLSAFGSFSVSVEMVSSSIDTFSVTVAQSEIRDCLHELMTKIDETASPNSVKIENDVSLIAVVGRRLAYNVGIAGRIFTSLGENGINIKMLEQGSDELSIIIGVSNADYKKAIKVLYGLI